MSDGNLNPETTLQQALDRSLVIQEQINTLLNDPGLFIPSLPTNKQTQIACGLFGLTIDQAWSVTLEPWSVTPERTIWCSFGADTPCSRSLLQGEMDQIPCKKENH